MSRSGSDDGLSATNISLYQPDHGSAHAQIGVDVTQSSRLCIRERKWQCADELRS